MIRARWVKVTGGIVLVAALVAMGFWLANIIKPNKDPLPTAVSSRLNFSPLIVTPTESSPVTDNYKLSTAEEGVLLLSFIIHLSDNRIVTVSEYPQPSQFNDVPDFRDKFLENVIQKTMSVSSASGTLMLGRMAKQENRQMAVMLENGLVVFLVPSSELTEDEWRALGDSLSLLKR